MATFPEFLHNFDTELGADLSPFLSTSGSVSHSLYVTISYRIQRVQTAPLKQDPFLQLQFSDGCMAGAGVCLWSTEQGGGVILNCVSLNISDFLNAKHYFNLDILSQPATLGVPGLDLWSRARPSLVSPCQQNIRFINTVILDMETRLDQD